MKKIPLKKMNSLVAPHKKRERFLTYNCDKETVNVYINVSPSIAQISAFVDAVADNVMSAEGDYAAEFKDILFDVVFIKMFTNIPVPQLKDSESEKIDLQRTYSFAQSLDLMSRARNEIPEARHLIGKLKSMIDDKVDFRKKQLLNLNRDLFYKSMRELSGIDGNMVNNLISKRDTLDEEKLVREVINYKQRQENGESV